MSNGITECESKCEKHVGNTRRVRVYQGCRDWGYFNYCEAAVATDISRGFSLFEEDGETEISVPGGFEGQARCGASKAKGSPQ